MGSTAEEKGQKEPTEPAIEITLPKDLCKVTEKKSFQEKMAL
jgi:hypothetical protein